MASMDDLYGRGMSWPFTVSTTGGIRESTGVRKVEESIRIILGTQYGERAMRPTFGCNLKSLAFSPNNSATANLAKFYVEDGVKQWEPRIDLTSVAVTNDPLNGVLLIQITYRLKQTPDIHNMVYPFYLEKV